MKILLEYGNYLLIEFNCSFLLNLSKEFLISELVELSAYGSTDGFLQSFLAIDPFFIPYFLVKTHLFMSLGFSRLLKYCVFLALDDY
jgi:hypothetical protein